MHNIIRTHIAGHGTSVQLPDTIIVHAMGEYIEGHHAVGYFSNTVAPYRKSAHSLIAPDGTNYRCREDLEGAWHAAGFNKNSLGIEFLVPGDHNYATFLEAIKTDYVTEAAYKTGLAQIKSWLHDWPITKIKRHSDVSPERKVDPGDGFPWERLLNDLGM